MNEYEQQATDFLELTDTGIITEFKEFGSMPFDKDGTKRNIFNITLINKYGSEYKFDFGSSLNDSLKNANDVLSVGKEIDLYYGIEFKGLDHQYLSYSQKIKVEDLKNAKTFNACAKLINKKKVLEIYADFVKQNTKEHYGKPNILPVEGRFGTQGWFELIVQSLIRKTTDLSNKNWGEPILKDKIIHPTSYDILTCLTKYDPGTFEDFCSEFGYDEDSRSAFSTYGKIVEEWTAIKALFSEQELEKLREIQ